MANASCNQEARERERGITFFFFGSIIVIV
jgi:hypothetical protein